MRRYGLAIDCEKPRNAMVFVEVSFSSAKYLFPAPYALAIKGRTHCQNCTDCNYSLLNDIKAKSPVELRPDVKKNRADGEGHSTFLADYVS